VTLPSIVITAGVWRDKSSGLKTATRFTDFRSKVGGFPDHFDDTSCVFRADDGRCSLKTLDTKDSKHPWFHKPLICWLHPINVLPERITLFDETTDPFRYPDYDGFASRTFLWSCGAARPPCIRGAPTRVKIPRTHSRQGPYEPIPHGRNLGK
jgi:hypothetical protein